MRIGDLTWPVLAAKSDWLPGSTYLGFTPKDQSLSARATCQSTIQRQFPERYVLEYVTKKFDEPNTGFENDPRILEERSAHAKTAGRLIALHKLRHSSRPLRDIVGQEEFELLQDMWAKPGNRHRWSVAFPIVETWEIPSRPEASKLFGDELYRSLFAYSSAYLRPLNEEARTLIADLEIVSPPAPNAWIAIEDEIQIAALSVFPVTTQKLIDRDLLNAFEGETEERKSMMRKRAGWLANQFWLRRFKRGEGQCDVCSFDPADRLDPKHFSLKTALDVHHRDPLAEGVRRTTVEDFALLCPTCHRIEHMMLKAGRSQLEID